MIKKIAKIIGLILFSIIVLVGLYIGVAIVLSRIEVSAERNNTRDVDIYLLSNDVHTDIVLPVKSALIDWSKMIRFKDTKIQDTLAIPYIAFGWGDKDFYLETPTWADLKFRTAFKAIFGLSLSAIHTTYFEDIVEADYCIKISLSSEQYSRLVKYIDSSFKKSKNGNYLHIVTNANYGTNDAFYEANHSFTLFNTCNTWTNTGLKVCGQKACLWTPFDKGILYQYNKNKR